MDSALMLLVDGRFPAGGHAYSAGVEAAVAVGDVVDVATLEHYLHGRLATTGRVDAAFAAYTCARSADLATIAGDLDDEYSARVMSPYLRATSRRLGRQLLARPAASGRVSVSPRCRRRQAGRISRSPSARSSPRREDRRSTPPRSPSTISARRSRRLPFACSASTRSNWQPCKPARGRAVDARRDEWIAWSSGSPSDLPAAGGSLTEILGERHGGLDARLFIA